MIAMFRVSLLVAVIAMLSACGFHLREGVKLPPAMQRIHLSISGNGELDRQMRRALQGSGVTVEDHSGNGIAELVVTSAAFRTDTLTISGSARVTEYAVRYHVDFYVKDANAETVVAPQSIDMSREFSYDAQNTIGTAAQTEELQRSLIGDMVQSILFRLQAAEKHAEEGHPAASSSVAAPVPAPVDPSH
ncbi:MAG TPA: LPS assembly lipoprotein LptE [Luteibacter sp.]|jgi:LPS-assembly lipoprotein|nr:LPS assembly lipoprotein LptE [Luteibacter sp.]